MPQNAIRVRYSAVDGFRKVWSGATVKGAQAFAQRYVGRHPEQGAGYAVSADGVGKIEALEGCTLADLFPPEPGAAPLVVEF